MIVAGGHHVPADIIGSDALFRKSEDKTAFIDEYSYSRLPEGNNVQGILFSGCNTNLPPKQKNELTEGDKILRTKFPKLVFQGGTDGTAPGYDNFKNLPTSFPPSKKQQSLFLTGGTSHKGKRAAKVKINGEWYYTKDGTNGLYVEVENYKEVAKYYPLPS